MTEAAGGPAAWIAAHFRADYRTPERSGRWDRWRNAAHDPEHLLASGERDVAAVTMPVIGPYDAADPAAAEYHVLLAKAAGLDAFAVHAGAGDEDDAAEALLVAAADLDFRIFTVVPGHLASSAAVVSHLRRRLHTLAPSAAHFRIHDRPVFFAEPSTTSAVDFIPALAA